MKNFIAGLSLGNITFWIILALAFLLPIFFIPFLGISPDLAKATLLQLLVVASLFLWLADRLRDGKVVIPKSWIIPAALLIPVTMFISALFSGAIKVSMLGSGNETGTVFIFLVFFLLLFLSSLFFQKTQRVFYLYGALALSAFILALYQILRMIFGADFLAFGMFNYSSASLIASWNDMSVFFGFIAILALTTLQFLSPRGFIKTISYVSLIVAMFFLALIDFPLSWVLLGVFSIIALVYSLSFGSGLNSGEVKKGYFTPLVVSIIAILFLLPSSAISGFLSTKIGISNLDARPSWGATIDITKEVIKTDPILGVGPNRFASAWMMFKQPVVNETVFWDTNFNSGVGIVPSSFVTTGVIGALAWIIFLVVFLYFGFKHILVRRENIVTKYLILSSFLSSLYFWLVSFLYIANVVNISMAFLFTGVFIALLVKDGTVGVREFSLTKDPSYSFITVMVLVIMIITSVVGEYFLMQRFLSTTSFSSGVSALNAGNVNLAGQKVARSLELYKNDVYYRALSEVQIAQLGTILSNTDAGEEILRAQFQASLGGAISNAQSAIEYDESNYMNWIALGRVYESVTPLGIDGAYENAVSAYENAIERNPTNPALYIMLARVDVAKEDLDGAKINVEKALLLKSNYTEALFLLSQIEEQSGNIKEAIAQSEKASLIAPNDIGIFFKLGFLKYTDDDYSGAIIALERAVALNPVYANAKYFLGLSYDKVGRYDEAIAQFKDIEYLNPTNSEVKNILVNLEAGRSPFKDAVVEVPPEERDAPPIEE